MIRNYFQKLKHLSLTSLIVLSACVTTDTVRFDNINRSPTLVEDIKILTKEPKQDFTVIARIQIGPDALISDYEGQTKEEVKKAAALGADAVIVTYDTSTVGYVSGTNSYGVFGSTSESKFTVGQAIAYK